MIRRRDFLTLVSCAAAVWPFAARAQQPTLPVIGYLSSTSSGPYAPFVAAFQQGLKETGFVAGQNVTIEYRWAEGQCAGGRSCSPSSRHYRRWWRRGHRTRRKASDLNHSDRVRVRQRPGKARPCRQPQPSGGNITGVSTIAVEVGQKRLQLLRDLLPKAVAIGFLMNPHSPTPPRLLFNPNHSSSAGAINWSR